MNSIERRQIETDQKFEQVFNALERRIPQPDYGIFFEGQIFDAYIFASDLIKSAKDTIILVDNFMDESVLTLLLKSEKDVRAIIYTKAVNKVFELDILKHNAQYPGIEVNILRVSHDRFLSINETYLYHIGASIKDSGKKWFAFSKMDSLASEVMHKLNGIGYGVRLEK